MTTPIAPTAYEMPTYPVVALLTETRNIIADPACWTQGVGARDALGNPCDPWAQQATGRCLLAALRTAAARLNVLTYSQCYDHALQLLEQQMPENLITSHNDDPETPHAEVLGRLDDAIAIAQANCSYAA